MLDYIIDWAALLFSGIAIIIALRVQRRQPELIAKQIAELDRASQERLGARVTAVLERGYSWAGRGARYTIRITNNGPAEAREINLQFPDGNSPIVGNERKLPVRVLHPTGSIQVTAAVSNDCAPPFHVLLSWHDALGEQKYETTLG